MSIGTCPLDELADVRLGGQTFLNDFFYLDANRRKAHAVESQYLESVFRMQDTRGNEEKFTQSAANTGIRLFACRTDIAKLTGTNAASYIRWGEKQYHKPRNDQPPVKWKDTPRVNVDGRPWYFSRFTSPPARIVVLKAFDRFFAPFILDKPVRVDQRFNQMTAKPGVDEDVLIGLLCSMWFVMTCETFGATAMGQGVLEVRTESLRELMVPDIRNLDPGAKSDWLTATKNLLSGPRLPAAKAAKTTRQQDLDACVLKALNLGADRLAELYTDTLRMEEVRQLLAAGRGTIRREKFAYDLDEVAKDVAAQLRPLLGGRRFPQDFLPAGVATTNIDLGNAPLHVRSEFMLGQRHVTVESAGQVVYEAELAEATGDLVVRAIQAGQRVISVPDDDRSARAALTDLDALNAQLDVRLNQLGSTAGAQAQAPLRKQAEEHLNFPVGLLLQELGGVYDADH
jgi:hypothetical protein